MVRNNVILDIQNVSVFYGGIHALHGVSLQVCEGEIVALIGANGAGKSTTLKTISGIVKARKGVIQFDGRYITNCSPDRIAQLGIAHVPEGRQPFANLTVYENLRLGAYRVAKQATINIALTRVFKSFPRLKERLSQAAGTLSGGELQMLAIGRGLMSQPRLLMLDEPSMGLSPILVNEIFSIIKEINSQGTSILLVEQNAHKALTIAHYAYVLETGRMIADGKAQELHKHVHVKEAYLGA